MDRPEITACICTCDRYALLQSAVASIVGQTLPRGRFEVIVVDTTAEAKRPRGVDRRLRRQGIRYLSAAGQGLSEARNLALKCCRAPVIAYLDDDAIADARWLATLVEGFERLENLGALGGRVEAIWEEPAPSWLPPAMYGYLSVVDWGDELADVGETRWLAGTNIAFRVAPTREAGGFRTYLGRRPGTLLGNEEIELCRRLAAYGLRVVYAPAARVRHRVSRERCTQAWIRRRVAWQAISDLISGPDPENTPERLRASIAHYHRLVHLTAGDPYALFADVETAEAFQAQCGAVRTYVMLLAGGVPVSPVLER